MIDLHAHTNASDGMLSPAGMVDAARAAGIHVVAITDHDTVAGVREGIQRGDEVGIEVIPGIEISSQVDENSVHMLGYFVDPEHQHLIDYQLSRTTKRRERMVAIIERLADLGIVMDADRVLGDSKTPGRPHIGRVLIERGLASDMRDAFRRYIGDGAPAFVPYPRLTTAEAIALIKQAGGIPVVGHPALDGLDPYLERLIAEGVEGIEVYHPDHDEVSRARYRDFARRHELLVTGGSDFHGPGKVGGQFGQVMLPAADLERLRQALACR